MGAHEDLDLNSALAQGGNPPSDARIAFYSQHGIELVNAGGHITSALNEHLVEHKLLPPFENLPMPDQGVNSTQILRRVKDLLLTNPRFALMTDSVPRETLLAAFYQMLIPPALAVKLTILSENRPQLFAHCIEVALVAVYLNGMSTNRIPDLATAAAAGLRRALGPGHASLLHAGSAVPMSG